MLQINAWTVFLAAFLTALATGLGAIPFFFVAGLARRWLGASNAAAAGLMVAASHSLINEGMPLSTMRVFVGVLAGLVFMAASRRLLSGGGRDLQIGQLRGADATKALIVVGAMTLHSVAEGVSVGVAYGGSDALGVFISAAIAVHNIPEGLAIQPRARTARRQTVERCRLECVLEPPSAAHGRSRLLVRADLSPILAGRARLRCRSNAVAGVHRASA